MKQNNKSKFTQARMKTKFQEKNFSLNMKSITLGKRPRMRDMRKH